MSDRVGLSDVKPSAWFFVIRWVLSGSLASFWRWWRSYLRQRRCSIVFYGWSLYLFVKIWIWDYATVVAVRPGLGGGFHRSNRGSLHVVQRGIFHYHFEDDEALVFATAAWALDLVALFVSTTRCASASVTFASSTAASAAVSIANIGGFFTAFCMLHFAYFFVAHASFQSCFCCGFCSGFHRVHRGIFSVPRCAYRVHRGILQRCLWDVDRAHHDFVASVSSAFRATSCIVFSVHVAALSLTCVMSSWR